MKKTLKILVIILATFLLITFVVFIFFRKTDTPLGETIRDVLPFGQGEGVVIPGQNGSPSGEEGTDPSLPTANLFRISDSPVAGATAIIRNGSTIIRYVDRGTGHIYDVNPVTLEKIKITNTTRTKIYEAIFNFDGSKVIFRSLKENTDEPENLSLTLTQPKATTTDEFYVVSTVALRDNASEIVSSGPNTIYMTLKEPSSITSANFDGTNQKNLYSSVFYDWKIGVLRNTTVIWTKALSNEPGYAYLLNTSGLLTKILGPLNGLVLKLHPTSQGIAYSYINTNGKLALMAKEGLDQDAVELYPPTIAEKCVWSTASSWILYCAVPQDSDYIDEPESWYKGKTHFTDRIYLFDTRVDISEVLAEPKKSFNTDIDAYNLTLSPDEDYLIFINKYDLSLWALKLR